MVIVPKLDVPCHILTPGVVNMRKLLVFLLVLGMCLLPAGVMAEGGSGGGSGGEGEGSGGGSGSTDGGSGSGGGSGVDDNGGSGGGSGGPP